MKTTSLTVSATLRLLGCALVGLTSSARAVLVSDNGFGTARMPVAAPYTTETPMQIVDGLPAGDVINIIGIFQTPTSGAEIAGGGLGGTMAGGVNVFQWNMQGSGSLSGFVRNINMPFASDIASNPGISPANYEIHASPRVANAPVQVFTTDMFRLFSQIVNPGSGDPDFDLLRLVAGTDFGLPSPGLTSFTQSGPNWDAGSFFDLTYRIDFVGRPGGQLAGRSGSTTGTVRISLGTVVPEPSAGLLTAALALFCCGYRRRR